MAEMGLSRDRQAFRYLFQVISFRLSLSGYLFHSISFSLFLSERSGEFGLNHTSQYSITAPEHILTGLSCSS